MTPRQKIFVAEYLVTLNSAEAARRAGYRSKSNRNAGILGFQILARPAVKEAIRAAMDARIARTNITADRVVEELARIAFADLRNVLSWGPRGAKLRPAREIADAGGAALAAVDVQVTGARSRLIRVRLHDKLFALDLLARHLGLFDRHKALAHGMDPAERQKLADRARAKLRRHVERAERMRAVAAIGHEKRRKNLRLRTTPPA